jgi:hydrogenase-4 component F
MELMLVLVPLAAAALAFSVPSERWRPWIIPCGAAVHLVLVLHLVDGGGTGNDPVTTHSSPHTTDHQASWLRLDPLGMLFLPYLSVLFFLCSLYAPAYLALRPDRPNRLFCANLLLTLAMMTLVTLSQHLGLMWVAMEAMTLISAPALYFNHNARSLEATWKYLLIGSVGIALALLGSFFLGYAFVHARLESSLFFDDLMANASRLSVPWIHAAFVLLFVGYGTKMGLAPMHTWKPDAYGEAPGIVGTLLAGGVTSCAFLAILRFYRVCHASGEGAFAREIMVFMGLLSMAFAAVFMVRQRDFKRMLAYSSVEHMGILVLGIGLGGLAVYGALLHLLNNGLTKGVLFLSAGNIHRAYGSKVTTEVSGALRRVPLSGALFLTGFLAITGSPPFGPFLSEFTIASAAMGSGHFLVGALFLLLLGIVFIGMGATVLAVVQGNPPNSVPTNGYHDSFGTSIPILLFLGLILLLGLYIPPGLEAILQEAAKFLEVKS